MENMYRNIWMNRLSWILNNRIVIEYVFKKERKYRKRYIPLLLAYIYLISVKDILSIVLRPFPGNTESLVLC